MKEIRYEVYTRHIATCKAKAKGRYHKGCTCPKWLYESRTRKRISAGTASWERATQVAREREDEVNRTDSQKQTGQLLLDRARAYVAALKQTGKSATFSEKSNLWIERRLADWLADKGILSLHQIEASHIEEWRTTWHEAYGVESLVTKRKVTDLVRMFFGHCVKNGWLAKNPCDGLIRITSEDPKAEYFTEEEFAKIDNAVDLYALQQATSVTERSQRRLRAFLHLLRWSGCRITDGATMRRNSLEQHGDRWRLRFRMIKTKSIAVVPIPPSLADELLALPVENKTYFFWSGVGDPETASKDWWEKLSIIFGHAKLTNEDGTPKRCKPHMLRDTFAVLALQNGASLEDVSRALGHRSIKITEKHYGHWSRKREDAMHEAISRTWGVIPIDSHKRKKRA